MHSHSYITRAVAAMDSCFTLIRVHQHDIAVRPLYGQSRFQRLLGPKALYEGLNGVVAFTVIG